MRTTIVAMDEGGAPESAPVDRFAVELAKALAAHGHDVTVMTDLANDGLCAHGVPGHGGSLRLRALPRLGLTDPGSEAAVRFFASQLEDVAGDLVLAVGEVAGRVAERTARGSSLRWAWVASEATAYRRRTLCSVWAPTSADAVLAHTRYEIDDLVARGVRRDRVHLLPLALWPYGEFREPLSTRVRLRRLAVALDETGEGASTVVSALRSLPDVEAVFVGPVHPTADASRAARRVSVLAAHMHVAQRISVLDSMSAEQMRQVMSWSDVVACLTEDAAPMSFLGSALASGAVPLVSAGGGVEEVVENGVSGLCLRAPDVRQVVTALRILDQDPDARNTMAIAARRVIREQLHPTVLLARYLEIAERLVQHTVLDLTARSRTSDDAVWSRGAGVLRAHA